MAILGFFGSAPVLPKRGGSDYEYGVEVILQNLIGVGTNAVFNNFSNALVGVGTSQTNGMGEILNDLGIIIRHGRFMAYVNTQLAGTLIQLDSSLDNISFSDEGSFEIPTVTTGTYDYDYDYLAEKNTYVQMHYDGLSTGTTSMRGFMTVFIQ